jgi:hypothetical protein
MVLMRAASPHFLLICGVRALWLIIMQLLLPPSAVHSQLNYVINYAPESDGLCGTLAARML